MDVNPFRKDIAEDLALWGNALGTQEDCPDDLTLSELHAWIRVRFPEIDATCEQWILKREWPELTPDLRWMIALRSSWATRLSLLMAVTDWPEPPHLNALRRLLIDSYHIGGPDSYDT